MSRACWEWAVYNGRSNATRRRVRSCMPGRARISAHRNNVLRQDSRMAFTLASSRRTEPFSSSGFQVRGVVLAAAAVCLACWRSASGASAGGGVGGVVAWHWKMGRSFFWRYTPNSMPMEQMVSSRRCQWGSWQMAAGTQLNQRRNATLSPFTEYSSEADNSAMKAS
eukprot:655827-Lingulodinium_polyedra.AAC.1